MRASCTACSQFRSMVEGMILFNSMLTGQILDRLAGSGTVRTSAADRSGYPSATTPRLQLEKNAAVAKKDEISPKEWLSVANLRRPAKEHVSPWFSGDTRPKGIGCYERHFESSKNYEMDKSSQWWDGARWLTGPGGDPAKEQVGDYPAWRGL